MSNRMKFDPQLAERLQIAVDRSGYSKTQIARMLHCDVSAISHWTAGRNEPSLENLYNFCSVIGESLDWIIGISDQISTKSQTLNGVAIRIVEPIINNHSLRMRDIEKGCELFRQALMSPDMKEDRIVASRLIRCALSYKSVQILEVKRDQLLEKTLVEKYKLQTAIVADVADIHLPPVRTEIVAFLAATEILEKYSGRVIGIGPGYTLMRLAELAIPNISNNAQWLSIHTDQGVKRSPSYAANDIVKILSRKFPASKAYPLPFLKPEDRNAPQSYRSHMYSHEEELALWRVLHDTSEIMAIFSTVGTITNGIYSSDGEPGLEVYNQVISILKREFSSIKLATEYLGYILDENGNPITNGVAEKVHLDSIQTLTWESIMACNLSGKSSWIVASGVEKASGVLATIQAGLANCIVIDKDIASFLIKR